MHARTDVTDLPELREPEQFRTGTCPVRERVLLARHNKGDIDLDSEKYFVFNERYGATYDIEWFETEEEAKQEAENRKKGGLREDEFVYIGEVLAEIRGEEA